MENHKPYDIIFIGTSMIPSYEAIYQSKLGKKVLMLDKSATYGGAWVTLDLFGFEKVENAIHYFLPDNKGFSFMRDVLKWELENSKGKYRVFESPIWGISRIAYDNAFADFFVDLQAAKKIGPLIKTFLNCFKNWLLGNKKISTYVKKGSADILESTRALLNKSTVEIRYNHAIEDVLIDCKNKYVELQVNANGGHSTIRSKQICITHGSVIHSLRTPDGPFEFVNKVHPRPAVHLLVEDSYNSEIFEAVFSNNKLIKYCHNITRFSENSDTGPPHKKQQKIFVLALQHDVNCYDAVYEDIFQLMKQTDLVGSEAKLLDHRWWDVTLPTLDDDDLSHFEKAFGEQVFTLKTEDFPRGIGLCADRWRTQFETNQ